MGEVECVLNWGNGCVDGIGFGSLGVEGEYGGGWVEKECRSG